MQHSMLLLLLPWHVWGRMYVHCTPAPGCCVGLPCRASREFSIEKALDKMMGDWEGLAFELGSWKSTGTFILKGEHP